MDKHIDLRLGRYQDVLADVECDAVIADPPFGERTHAAWRSGERESGADYKRGAKTRGKRGGSDIAAKLKRGPITYGSWTPADVDEFVRFWAPRCRGWIVALTSHDLAPAYQASYEAAGLYSFAPLPCVTWGGSIRLSGDGPSSWTVWAMVARPKTREMQRWGTLPGAYDVSHGHHGASRGGPVGGRGKPLDLMRAIVNDYSRPGDLVCDPCAGYGSTLAAALTKGRRAVGAEVDAEVHAEALRRLAGVQYVDLFDSGRASQGGLEL